MPGRVAIVFALVACAAVFRVAPADAHPLHTTLADVQLDRATGVVHVMVRVFVDDVDDGISHAASRTAVDDSRRVAYISARLSITDQHGRSIPLRPCGVSRRANLLWICLSGNAGSSATLVASDALLVDVYSDQVNLVKATDGHLKRTVLFTRGDRAKPIL